MATPLTLTDSILPAFLIFGHVGFTLLQIGLCRPKNTSSIIIANMTCIFVSILMYWITGFAFALPNSASNFFLSHTRFFLIDATTDELRMWTIHALIVSLVIVMMNAGFVERMRFWLYPFLTIFISGFIFPVSSHWAWNEKAWLKKGVNISDEKIVYMDEGGAAAIHVFVGGAGLVGTCLVGPRLARVTLTGSLNPLGGQINAYVVVGGLLAFIGLYAKTLILSTPSAYTSVNCLLSASASATVAFLLKRTGYTGDIWNSKTLVNAALAGLVAVGGAPAHYHPYGGFVIGIVAGLAYTAWDALLVLCQLDDPCDIAPVHLSGGMWGTLAIHLFHKKYGILYHGTKQTFLLFAWNLVGALAMFAWAGLCVFLLLIWFVLCGKLKYSKDSSIHARGMDLGIHREPAYPDRDYYPGNEGKSIFDTYLVPKTDENGGNGFYGNEVYHNAGFEKAHPQQQKRRHDEGLGELTQEEQRYQYWVQQQQQKEFKNTVF